MSSGNGCAAMGTRKIRYLVTAKCGRAYWRPTEAMKKLGFKDQKLGPDGPKAWELAEEWNARWDKVRRGESPAPITATKTLTREEAEAARVYPVGSVGEAWQRWIKTPTWAKKPLSTRQKEWWPAWYRIRDMWGDVDPKTITFDMMSAWRDDPDHGLEAVHGRYVAHKTFKIWRSFWRVMTAMRYTAGRADPSQGIANPAPGPRDQSFNEGEIVRRVKDAWRKGYKGLACVIAVAWDTSFSPGDVRLLTAGHRRLREKDGRLYFDRTKTGRTKTGKAAIGTLSKRTQRLVEAYIESLPVELSDSAFIFRTRSGLPYRDDTLADDFAAMRPEGDKRQLRDVRRSGSMETVAGGATPSQTAAKLANSFQSANAIHKTYSPVDMAAVEAADDARMIGRQRIRANKGGAKVANEAAPKLQIVGSENAKTLK